MKEDKKSVGLLTFGHAFVDAYGGFLAPLMPFIAEKIKINVAEISLILAVSHLTSSMLQPVFGYISDNISRRFFIIAGMILATVFMSLAGLADNAFLLCLCVVLGNMGVGFFHPQSMAMVGYFSGERININMSTFTAFGTLGYALGPIVSSKLVEKFGLHSTIYALTPGLLIAALLYFLVPKIPDSVKKREKYSFKDVLSDIILNKTILILTMQSIIKSLVLITFSVFMPFLWKTQGHTVGAIGVALGFFSGFGGLGAFVGGRIAEIIGGKKVFLVSLLPLTPLALSALYFAKINPLVSFIFFVLTGFFATLSVSVNLVMAQKVIKGYEGMISGIVNGFAWGTIGIMLTPLGFLVQKFGVLQVLAVVSVVPWVGAFFVSKIPKEVD